MPTLQLLHHIGYIPSRVSIVSGWCHAAVLRSSKSRPNSCASLCQGPHAVIRTDWTAVILCFHTGCCCRLLWVKRVHVAVFLVPSHPCCSSSLQSSHSVRLLPLWWWCKCILYVYRSILLLQTGEQLPGLHALPPAVQSKRMALLSHWDIRTNSVPGYLLMPTGSTVRDMCVCVCVMFVSVGGRVWVSRQGRKWQRDTTREENRIRCSKLHLWQQHFLHDVNLEKAEMHA